MNKKPKIVISVPSQPLKKSLSKPNIPIYIRTK